MAFVNTTYSDLLFSDERKLSLVPPLLPTSSPSEGLFLGPWRFSLAISLYTWRFIFLL